jgi:hypothetical protein
MAAGFLLRFQEAVRPPGRDDRTAKTKTSVENERPDERPLIPFAATKTLTEVKREQADADPQAQSFFALPL